MGFTVDPEQTSPDLNTSKGDSAVPEAAAAAPSSFGRALCLGGALLGAVGLLGWLAGVDVLVTLVPGLAPIMPNAAMALMLLGVAAALRRAKHPGRSTRWLWLLAASCRARHRPRHARRVRI